MARSGVCCCGGCEEHDVAFGEVGDGVEDRGFCAVEACSAQHVDDGWSQQRAVEVVGLRRHGLWLSLLLRDKLLAAWGLVFLPQYHGAV